MKFIAAMVVAMVLWYSPGTASDMNDIRALITHGHGGSFVVDIQNLRQRIVCKVSPKGCIETDLVDVSLKVQPFNRLSGVFEKDIKNVWDEIRVDGLQGDTLQDDVSFVRHRITSGKGVSLEQDIRDTRRMIVSIMDEGGCITGDLFFLMVRLVPLRMTTGVLQRDFEKIRRVIVPERRQEGSLWEDLGDPSAMKETTGLSRLIKNGREPIGTLNDFDMTEFDGARTNIFDQIYQFIRVLNQKPCAHEGAKYICIPYGNYNSLWEILAAMNHDLAVMKSDKPNGMEKYEKSLN